jgi:hypothetical protein
MSGCSVESASKGESIPALGARDHAVGMSDVHGGRVAIRVLVDKVTRDLIQATPNEIDGAPVDLWEVGEITAYQNRSFGTGKDPRHPDRPGTDASLH